jgi:hypothetical protein
MRWFGKRKAAESAEQEEKNRAIGVVRAGLADGSISDAQAARMYLGILYPGGGPVRGSFDDLGSYTGRCRHMAPYPGCPGGCSPDAH